MEPGEFDLVGFAVGVAERDQLITGEHVATGDVLIGLPVAQPALERLLVGPTDPVRGGRPVPRRPGLPGGPPHAGRRAARTLGHLRPGGGRADPIGGRAGRGPHHRWRHPRATWPGSCPTGCDAVVDRSTWESPRIFGELQQLGDVSDEEMARVFNLGIGMIVVVPEADSYKALDVLRAAGQRATVDRLGHPRHRHRHPHLTRRADPAPCPDSGSCRADDLTGFAGATGFTLVWSGGGR